jgi:membrane complex biogenesis BtpA family protein
LQLIYEYRANKEKMMGWLEELFGTVKPIIAMLHLQALPGDPAYDPQGGMDKVLEHAHRDLTALQAAGVDAIMISNESSLPYLTEVEPITTASMARIIGELREDVTVPYGVNVLWDPIASIDLAVATDARFVREIFTGVYASDFGLWNTNCGRAIRHRNRIGGQHIRLLFNIVPEAAAYLGERPLGEIARSTVFNTNPDGICVSGLTAGVETSTQALITVKQALPNTVVFANTGVRETNVEEQLGIADGAVVGTTFKVDNFIWNPVDEARVTAFMQKVRTFRGNI